MLLLNLSADDAADQAYELYTILRDMAMERPVACLAALLAAGLSLSVARSIYKAMRVRMLSTYLQGPPRNSLLFGVNDILTSAADSAELYEAWVSEYGSALYLPAPLGARRMLLTDPRALASFFPAETTKYEMSPLTRRVIGNIIGKGLLYAMGDDHKRQRRQLSPGFTNAMIKSFVPTFTDAAYKAKAHWDAIIDGDTEDSTVLDVQKWMNHISLDSIGIAGFSHDFASLDSGRSDVKSPVADVFDSFATVKSSVLGNIVFMLSGTIPALTNVPTARSVLVKRLNKASGEMAQKLLNRDSEAHADVKREERSIMTVLLRGVEEESSFRLSHEELSSQMKTLMLAGYETSSVTLTWALIELCFSPNAQDRLREELLAASATGADPNWEQLTNGLPYLDAVVHETLRLHPAVPEVNRVAVQDDVLPLSAPVTTAGGAQVSSIFVAKGTLVTVPIRMVNRSTAFWGEDAKEFKPERWLNGGAGLGAGAREIQGTKHLLTFIDGPRTCIGKGFALAEIKAVLGVLVRSFVFDFPAGNDTKIGSHRAIVIRPKLEGEDGAKVPMRIRRVE